MEHDHPDALAPLELGLSTFTYGWTVGAGAMDVRVLVAKAGEFGLRRVQFGDNLAAEKFSDEDWDFLRSCGVTVELGAFRSSRRTCSAWAFADDSRTAAGINAFLGATPGRNAGIAY